MRQKRYGQAQSWSIKSGCEERYGSDAYAVTHELRSSLALTFLDALEIFGRFALELGLFLLLLNLHLLRVLLVLANALALRETSAGNS